MTQAQSLADLSQQYVQSALGNRNLIVDGNFENTAPASAVFSVCTMFHIYAGASGAGSTSRSTFTLGQEPPGILVTPNLGYLQYVQSTASNGTFAAGTLPVIYQAVESVKTLAGQSATYSFWACGTAGGEVISPLVSQVYGTGGSPSTSPPWLASAFGNITLTKTWTRYSVRFDIPGLAGVTLGTNNNDCLSIGFALQAGVTPTINMTQWQLERCWPGAPTIGVPTPFEYRGPQSELARVQRHYTGASLPAMTSNGSGIYNGGFESGYLKASMRAKPAVALLGALTGNATGGLTLYGYQDQVSVSFATVQPINLYYDGINIVADARL